MPPLSKPLINVFIHFTCVFSLAYNLKQLSRTYIYIYHEMFYNNIIYCFGTVDLSSGTLCQYITTRINDWTCNNNCYILYFYITYTHYPYVCIYNRYSCVTHVIQFLLHYYSNTLQTSHTPLIIATLYGIIIIYVYIYYINTI